MAMGKFGKGILNSNGKELLESSVQHEMVLTNTFDHPLRHRTTWESPYRQCKCADGTIRHNPFRNQIDYILIRMSCEELVRISRSHSGTTTFTDHRLVRIKMDLVNRGTKKRVTKKIDYMKLRDPVMKAQ
jgi:hypothetical protein